MPFGLTNAPASFQNLINEVMDDLIDKCVVVYLDDILIYSDNMEEHLEHIKQVLERLRAHHLWVKAEKCEFFKDQVAFLGYVVGNGELGMDPAKVHSILDWARPKTVRQVRSFLGFCNFYRRFIVGYSKIARPLHRLTEQNRPWTWGPEEQNAFDCLKHVFTTAPVL